MDVFPDFGGDGGASDLRAIVGALLMFVLIMRYGCSSSTRTDPGTAPESPG